MRRAIKVAIIGAGPSGLVTAKTLLRHYPNRFEPVIFDSKPIVGGLWAVARPDTPDRVTPDFIDCFMRTNLSRFTVSFSDHSWENHRAPESDQDLFPQAWEVGDYLKSYAARFLPEEGGEEEDILRLSCRVVRTRRNPDTTISTAKRWTVEWIEEDRSNANIGQSRKDEDILDPPSLSSESFDYLVVASGYFSRPYIPDVPGLHEFPLERVMHSSSLKSSSSSQLLQTIRSSGHGKIVVVGGSMSGAEAAASLALDLSTDSQTMTVHHISTRPFWAVPTYLPANDQPGSFLPLDLVMYDLARRPPGDIQFSLGPVTSERANVVHKYFESLIGSDQSDIAEALAINAEEDTNSAPWVAVTDHYAEFARAGDITPTLGRVVALHWNRDAHSEEAKGVVEVENRQGGRITIDNVAAVVFATGFTPFGSLSFLPADVLAALEFSESDTVFPIVLDEKGTWNPDIPDLGFVGFYRGPYWGVMEMQARALARRWDRDNAKDIDVDFKANTTAVGKLRVSPPRLRAQFPMGDYVGLIETYARELDIRRLSLLTGDNDNDDDGERSGPAIPARYFVPLHNSSPPMISTDAGNNHATTLTSLRSLLVQPSSKDRQRARCKAVLRALHGKWRYEQRASTPSSSETAESGQASIHLRKVHDSNTGFRTEYVYKESSARTAVTIFRDSKDDYIYITGQDGIQRKLEFVSVEEKEDQNFYRHVVREAGGVVPREYAFDIRGVTMLSWEERTINSVTRYARR